jgi:N6-adenosine-specific RNA methylase IME4
VKLQDIGVNRSQSSRWQQIAGIYDRSFEEHITTTTAGGRELTSSSALKLSRQLVSQAPVTPEAQGDATRGTVANLGDLLDKKTRYRCVCADPPWPYDNQGTRGATDNHYGTMSLEALAELHVAQLVARQAHLHLRTTNSFLPHAFWLIEAWGFAYKSCLVWTKPQLGLGNYWRVSHEFLLLGVRGELAFARRSQRSWVETDRLRHSQKPELFRELVQQVSPGPYLELFGRAAVPGWTVFGNQIK